MAVAHIARVGWKVVLTPRVPKLTQAVLPTAFADLVATLPSLPPSYQDPSDFDWAMHPGGATILAGAEKALDISSYHMRASYDVYMNHGNSSSATIFSVLDSLRCEKMDALAPDGRVRDYVFGCAFGPGITVETCMLRRNLGARGISGLQTPPETESEESRSETGDELAAETRWDAEMLGEAKIPEAGAQLSENLAGREQTDSDFVAHAIQDLDLD